MSISVVSAGCHEEPAPPQTAASASTKATNALPSTVVAPIFFVPQQDQRFATIIVPQSTTDSEVSNLLWLLRDAVHSRSLNSLGISETLVETRDRMYTLHIYRGVKCVDHDYHNHKPPCASSKGEAGLFQVGSYGSPDGDAAILEHRDDESKDEQLWSIDSPYMAKPNIRPSPEMIVGPLKEARRTWGSEAQTELADNYTQQVWGGGLHAIFATTATPGELKMSADWLVAPDARKAVASSFEVHRKEACAAGFRSVRLSSLFPSNHDSIFSLDCQKK